MDKRPVGELVEPAGDLAIDHGEAVARLERTLDLDLERDAAPAALSRRPARAVREGRMPWTCSTRTSWRATSRSREGRGPSRSACTVAATTSGSLSRKQDARHRPSPRGLQQHRKRRRAHRRPSPRGSEPRIPRARSSRRTPRRRRTQMRARLSETLPSITTRSDTPRRSRLAGAPSRRSRWSLVSPIRTRRASWSKVLRVERRTPGPARADICSPRSVRRRASRVERMSDRRGDRTNCAVVHPDRHAPRRAGSRQRASRLRL